MSLKESEQKMVKDAKAEFDYVTDPDNCGVVVRNHFGAAPQTKNFTDRQLEQQAFRRD